MNTNDLNILKTGTEGLDSILMGGLPSNRVYLLEGNPGTGKTSLSLRFLMEGISSGERCLYVALSESKGEMEAVARTHGWNLDGIDIFELPEEKRLEDAQNTFFYSSEIELGETNEAIMNEIKRVNPSRVVFDSLSELKLLAQDPMKFRRQVMALKQYFLKQGATVLLLDDKTASGDLELQSIVHGVIRLEQLAPEFGAERRRLKVTKLRGLSYRGGYHDFLIRKGGLVVFPRLVAAEHTKKSSKPKGQIVSGIRELDTLLGGGIDRGTSTLLIGPAGSGKSSLAIQYAMASAQRGEKTAVFAFDEAVDTMLARAKGMGADLQKYVDDGLIEIRQIDPAELSPGEFMYLVRESVESGGAKMILIDSLNGYLNAMPEERFLVIQMHELLSYLGQMNIATFLVVAQHGLLGAAMETVVDISYLADNVVLHRYYECRGDVRQALSVVKKRSGPHERTIRRLELTSEGLKVGAPLKDFQGILSGIPTILTGAHDRP